MANVYLTSVTSPGDEHGQLELGYLQESVRRDRFGVHQTTDDPAGADLIVFAERVNAAGAKLEKIRAHPHLQQFREKCFVFNPRYKDVPLLPGVYASIQKRWYNARRMRSGHYPEVSEEDFARYDPEYGEDPYLYSFMGKRTNPVREDLYELGHPRGFCRDTSEKEVDLRKVNDWGKKEENYIQRYVDVTKRSKFVLCPRGVGPSSLRLFETLLLGRVPVIISDQWTPPRGPEWELFSLRVAERDVKDLPDLLERFEPYAEAMGRRARRVWEQWFSPEASFHRVVEWCLGIKQQRALPESVSARFAYTQLLRPSRLYEVYRPIVLGPLRKLKNSLL